VEVEAADLARLPLATRWHGLSPDSPVASARQRAWCCRPI
jgi:hypothetical protein